MKMEDFLTDKIQEIAFVKVSTSDLLWTHKILDSITIIELIVEIENEYGVNIPTSDIVEENFETVDLIVQYLERNK